MKIKKLAYNVAKIALPIGFSLSLSESSSKGYEKKCLAYMAKDVAQSIVYGKLVGLDSLNSLGLDSFAQMFGIAPLSTLIRENKRR